MNVRRASLLPIALAVMATLAGAQESGVHAALRQEWGNIKSSCSTTDSAGRKKSIKQLVPGCGESLFHGNKGIFASIATLPPSNGIALGVAVKNNELPTANWRLSFQVDGQGSFNGSWTTGGFLRMQHAPSVSQIPRPVPGVPTGPSSGATETLTLNLYAFHTSLQNLSYYGIGPASSEADRALHRLSESIVGIQAVQPLKYGFHLLGELNGRWPDIAGRHGDSHPSIEQVFSETNTPGLLSQPGFLQPGIGLEFTQNFSARLALDYTAKLQAYSALSNSHYSFRRLTLDFNHSIYPMKAFSGKKIPGLAPVSGDVSPTSERIATLTLRALLVQSVASAGSVVPFYFQPTLGGTDLDKQHLLSSYEDYRFRAPNMELFRAQYEQPLPKLTFLGVILRADAGKVAQRRSDLDFSHFRHTWGAGLTLRAGNFPYVMLMYAWGGPHNRVVTDVNLSAISGTGGRASLW